jgi:hypothetical protein
VEVIYNDNTNNNDALSRSQLGSLLAWVTLLMSKASPGAWGGLLGALGRLTWRTGAAYWAHWAAYWAHWAAYVLLLLCDAPPEVEVRVIVRKHRPSARSRRRRWRCRWRCRSW